MTGFLHMTDHWKESAAPAEALVVFSELPRGRSPVATNTFTINFVLAGTETYDFGGRVSRVEAGNFLLVEPGSTGHGTLGGEGVVRGLSLYLPSAPHSPAATADPALVRQFQFRADTSRLGRLLLGAGRRFAANVPLTSAECAHLIAVASAEFEGLCTGLATEMLRLEARKPATRRDLLRRLHRARDYLLSQPDRAIPLAELAQFAGMSQFHLARSFAAVFGTPPVRFHLAARLAAADGALRAGRLSTDGAALGFGFADRSSFSRAFRRVYGLYPAQAARGVAARGHRPEPAR